MIEQEENVSDRVKLWKDSFMPRNRSDSSTMPLHLSNVLLRQVSQIALTNSLEEEEEREKEKFSYEDTFYGTEDCEKELLSQKEGED